jgi:hypothetical protein
VIEAGLKLTKASAGNPLKLRATVLLKPPTKAEVDTVKEEHPPTGALVTVGVTDRAKVGGGTKLNINDP